VKLIEEGGRDAGDRRHAQKRCGRCSQEPSRSTPSGRCCRRPAPDGPLHLRASVLERHPADLPSARSCHVHLRLGAQQRRSLRPAVLRAVWIGTIKPFEGWLLRNDLRLCRSRADAAGVLARRDRQPVLPSLAPAGALKRKVRSAPDGAPPREVRAACARAADARPRQPAGLHLRREGRCPRRRLHREILQALRRRMGRQADPPRGLAEARRDRADLRLEAR
jgi:hypothetical protein